jgi:hypothetical protein
LSYTLEKIGAVSRNRTHHASAFNAALYQLSYHGKKMAHRAGIEPATLP